MASALYNICATVLEHGCKGEADAFLEEASFPGCVEDIFLG
jgi:hypothetical protein